MSNIMSLDGHDAAIADGERARRFRVIRREGVQLMRLYKSIPDKIVRDEILAFVTVIAKSAERPLGN